MIRKSTTEELELEAPQTIEAYRAARSAKSAADKRAYTLEQQLEEARRSNGLMVEQMHADRDRAAALSADLDDMRAEHEAAIAIVQTALDEANRKIAALEQALRVANGDEFFELPKGSPMAEKTPPGLVEIHVMADDDDEPAREVAASLKAGFEGCRIGETVDFEEAERIMAQNPLARFRAAGDCYLPKMTRLRDAVTEEEGVMP